MTRAPRRLPPFSTLTAFDAAVRHGTLTRAARELNVSQPAVSRRIAALERDLGTAVFVRSHRPLTLTAQGRRLFEVLRASLSRLEETVDEIRATHARNTVVIGADPGFASFWLLPRLPALQAAFPELSLRILTGDLSRDRDALDLAIAFGPGTHTHVGRLLGEDVFAVAGPAYLAGRRLPLSVAEIREQRLLHLEDPEDRWYSWKSWFAQLRQPPADPPVEPMQFNDYSLLIRAALAGQGVALGWAGLIDSLLENGTLVRISRESVRSERGYFLACADPKNVSARAVADWLLEAATKQVGAVRAEPAWEKGD